MAKVGYHRVRGRNPLNLRKVGVAKHKVGVANLKVGGAATHLLYRKLRPCLRHVRQKFGRCAAGSPFSVRRLIAGAAVPFSTSSQYLVRSPT